MRPWIAVITFVAGGVLWLVSRRQPGRDSLPPWTPRLGVGMVAMGLSTMAIELRGPTRGVFSIWDVISSLLSLVAIAIFFTIVRDLLRRR